WLGLLIRPFTTGLTKVYLTSNHRTYLTEAFVVIGRKKLGEHLVMAVQLKNVHRKLRLVKRLVTVKLTLLYLVNEEDKRRPLLSNGKVDSRLVNVLKVVVVRQ